MDKKMIEPTDEMINDVELRHKLMRMDDIDIMRATLNHPDAAKLFADDDDRPWEPLTKGNPVRVGDEVRRVLHGITTTVVVGRVDEDGDLWTADDIFIGTLEDGTWHVRRLPQELPTKGGAVIVANDGHEDIEATGSVNGTTWRAKEAVLGPDGRWHGVWYSDSILSAALPSFAPEAITLDTWKVKEK